MEIMTHAKFHFNRLMLTLIFGVWASEPPLGPGERLKRPGLIGLNCCKHCRLHCNYFEFLTKRNGLYFQPIRLQLRRYRRGYIWNRKL